MHDESWESPNCPICQTDKYLKARYPNVTTWEYPGNFSFLECQKCHLVLQSPRIASRQVSRYYPPESYWGHVDDPWKEYGTLYQGIFAQKSPGNILDVGAGMGLFLSEFAKRGWTCTGTEISAKMVRSATKRYGLKILQGDLLRLKIPRRSFDVITLNNVLEHLYEPRQTLEKIHQLIKPDGLLVIAVPNFDSWGRRIFRQHWHCLQPGRHVYHFSPATLNKLLKLTGFKIHKIDHGYWRHNYYSWFMSLRYLFSPRFKKRISGGLSSSAYSKKSLVKELGKLAASLIAGVGAFLGQVFRNGEVIIIYAYLK